MAFAAAIAVSLIGGRFVSATPAVLEAHGLVGVTHTLLNAIHLEIEAKLVASARERDRLIVIRPNWFDPRQGDARALLGEFRPEESPGDIWTIAQSSGTTGTPKFVVFPYSIAYEREARRDEGDAVAGRGFLYLFPPVSAFITAMLGKLAHGGTLIARNDRLSEGIDTVTGSPFHIANLISAREAAGVTSRIRLAVVGGGATPPELYRLIRRHFSEIRIGYGSTEAGRTCTLTQPTGEPWPKSVGRPLPGCSVEILGEGGPVAPGEVGEVRVRTPYMATGYLGEAADPFLRDGWFYPGDRGSIDAKGQLVVHGRIEDMLNIGGRKFDATRIDAIAAGTKGIRDAMAFAHTDRTGMTRLAVLAVPQAQESAPLLAQRLAVALEQEGGVVPPVVFVVDELPRNENGKPLRGAAAEIARRHRSAD